MKNFSLVLLASLALSFGLNAGKGKEAAQMPTQQKAAQCSQQQEQQEEVDVPDQEQAAPKCDTPCQSQEQFVPPLAKKSKK